MSLGLLIGSLLTEGCVLLSLWRSIPHDEFHALYRKLHPLLYRYFTPVTVSALVLTLASSIASWPAFGGFRLLSWSPFVLCLAVTLTHEVYFKRANDVFKAATLDAGALAAELRRWSMWHWIRTAIGFVAFGLSVFDLAR